MVHNDVIFSGKTRVVVWVCFDFIWSSVEYCDVKLEEMDVVYLYFGVGQY